MIVVLVILAAVILTAFGLHAYKRVKEMREQRMTENEYATAVTLWQFSRILKNEIDDAARHRTGVLDFRKIMIPHGHGYRVSLELTGYNLRVYGVPIKHNRTGRLSFYIDNTLTLRASDRHGKPATERDDEYAGIPSSM